MLGRNREPGDFRPPYTASMCWAGQMMRTGRSRYVRRHFGPAGGFPVRSGLIDVR